jgi:Fe-S oxidoreductase
MARLKAECLFQKHKLNGTTLRAAVLSQLPAISRAGSLLPTLNNALTRLPFVSSLLGFSAKRQLPKLAARRFSQWFSAHTLHANAGRTGQIILLNDMFVEYYEPALGRSAVELLERWGFKITLSPCFASPRLSISLGMLEQAQARMAIALDWLQTKATNDTFIIGLEPSELLTYRDEASALPLLESQMSFVNNHQKQFVLFEEFLSEHRRAFCADVSFKEHIVNIALHIHCHQKSLSNGETCIKALQILPQADIQSIPSGCCGMAGLFGYERQNFTLSQQIGELVLFPFIRNLSQTTKIVATGASCRQQLQDFLNTKAYHPAEILYQQLA